MIPLLEIHIFYSFVVFEAQIFFYLELTKHKLVKVWPSVQLLSNCHIGVQEKQQVCRVYSFTGEGNTKIMLH